jgi:7-cyano-7-deazaguanine reductase
MNTPQSSRLGQPTAYVDQYDASLLYPIPRAGKRAEIGIGVAAGETSGTLPFLGADLWMAYELSWLNLRGKPQVALATFTVPCETRNIIESKSLKLYLNSFNNTPFASVDEVKARLRADLSEAVWRDTTPQTGDQAVRDSAPAMVAPPAIGVSITGADLFDREPIHELDGLSLDRLDMDFTRYTPAPELLTAAFDEQPVSEVLTSNLLKSNCLVTGQPDWGALQISYSGPQIDQGGLLQYIVSFRSHNEFHEQCVERIFMDIWQRCKPVKLAVYARYTRRGGLDINPFRTSYPQALPKNVRMARQ